MRNDIQSLADIQILVNEFYTLVQKDELIGGIFAGTIKDWPIHLEKMYRFWQTILLTEHTYTGSPFPPHAQMPIQQKHFDRWLNLWEATIDLHFEGAVANEAKNRGQLMAQIFLSKINYLKEQSL